MLIVIYLLKCKFLLAKRFLVLLPLLLQWALSFPVSFEACFSSTDELSGERFNLLLVSHSQILENALSNFNFENYLPFMWRNGSCIGIEIFTWFCRFELSEAQPKWNSACFAKQPKYWIVLVLPLSVANNENGVIYMSCIITRKKFFCQPYVASTLLPPTNVVTYRT